MDLIIENNYNSTVFRGLITPNTTPTDFINKLHEEVKELEDAFCKGSTKETQEELADVILVCLNFARHYSIDIENELKLKIKKNYDRSKNSE